MTTAVIHTKLNVRLAVDMRKNDRGYKNLIKGLKTVGKRQIKAGIFKEAKASRSANGSDADNLAYRYKIHDEGLGNNPKRETLNPATEKYIKTGKEIEALFIGLDQGSPQKGMQLVGQKWKGLIQKEITDLKAPKKSDSTIESAKRLFGGNRTNPLIQTGEMWDAVKFRIERK